MNNRSLRHATVALAAAWLSTGLSAQPTQPTQPTQPASATPGTSSTSPSDPAQTLAPVPALAYRSALQTYRPWREQAPGDWRALNDEVTRIGGWRAYLREVHQAPADTSNAAPQTPALAPASSGTSTSLNKVPAASPGSAASGPLPSAAATPAKPSKPTTPKGHHHGHH